MPLPNRRTFLKGLTGALALAGVGSADAHPGGGDHEIHEHHVTKNADLVGHHSLGGVGGETAAGDPNDNPLYGALSEVWVEGDLAFVSLLSTSGETANRGVAIVDVSGYTTAGDAEDLEKAEMNVLSFVGNETEAGAVMDVKVSDDAQYLFCSKQAIGATYGDQAWTSTDTYSAPGAEPLGIEAYDISDPKNPQYVGTAQGPHAGFHNCFTHRIGGEHYVFGVQGVTPGSAGVTIFRLLDDAAGLEPVNFWGGENLSQGGYGAPGSGPYAAGYYCHDFYAHDDPVTGKPLGFVAYWNHGVRVLDLSDPTDITELGYGEMDAAHYAQPAPALIDGKRVFIGGQEHSSQSNGISGGVRLFDADGLFGEGLTRCDKLDAWTLYQNVSYEGYAFSPHNADVTADGWISLAHYHAGVRFLKIQPPAESRTGQWRIAGKRHETVGERYEIDADGEQFDGIIGPGAFGTTRETHEFTPPDAAGVIVADLSWTENTQDNDFYLERNESGDPENPEWTVVASSRELSGPEHLEASVEAGTLHRFVVETFANAAAQYHIEATYYGLDQERVVAEEGLAYYRDHVEVPDDSVTLSRPMSPNFWGARVENGVTFASGMNTGLYAIAADPMEVGTRAVADVTVERSGDSGSVHSPGDTVTLKYDVDTDKAVRLRDRLPSDWSVVGGDAADTLDVGDGTRVTFEKPATPGEGNNTFALEVEVGDERGARRLGPVRYSADGGDTWEPLVGSESTALVGP